MKNHLLTLFDSRHRKLTISFFLASALLITTSQVVGITDNTPGILMLLAGMVSLFLGVLHPWQTLRPYTILIGICLGLIPLTFLVIYLLTAIGMDKLISEGLVMGFIGLLCVPGILAGTIGVLYLSFRNK